VSYGAYIYAPYPTTQARDWLLHAGPAVLIGAAAPTVWLLGLVSWRLVERPMLRLKHGRIRGAGQPMAAHAGSAGANSPLSRRTS
jgi:peptidoglycan/LPS O-acetylase OafA/YrhL